MAEAGDLKSLQSGFESQRGHPVPARAPPPDWYGLTVTTSPDEPVSADARHGGLRDGGKGAPPRIDRPWVSILRPVIALVACGIGVGVLLLWALEPSANDGAAAFLTMTGVPMVVVALTIQLVAHNSLRHRRVRFDFLWWLFAVLPIGLLAASVPAILSDPAYFGSASVGGTLGVLTMHTVLLLLGFGFGALLWFFIVMPLFQLIGTVIRLVRGEKNAAAGLIMPLILLALGGVILVGAGALDLSDALPGRFGWPQIVMALLGIPGSYRVESELGLWVVRGLIVAAALVFLVPWWATRRSRRATRRAR